MSGTDRRVVRSTRFDPFFNLAAEDLLFRTAPPGRETLFLWVNDPAVVVGRYQNPWLECRLGEMERQGVAFVRRQSGGGAVYHDRGNLCVSFMGERRSFDREANIDLVRSALKGLGAETETNERNDILLGGRKVSGSAYRECADRSFHHLTLLVDADLEALSRFLNPAFRFQKTKGVASVRSPVANLRSAAAGLSVQAAAGAIEERFSNGGAAETTDGFDGTEIAEIERVAERWRSWEWRFGGSPDFTVRLESGTGEEAAALELAVRGGLIAEARMGDADASFLEGERFDPETLAEKLRADARFARCAEAAERF